MQVYLLKLQTNNTNHKIYFVQNDIFKTVTVEHKEFPIIKAGHNFSYGASNIANT